MENIESQVDILAILEKNGGMLKHVKNQTEEMKWIALCSANGSHVIKYVENPTRKMEIFSVKRYAESIRYIENPTDEMYEIAIKGGNFLDDMNGRVLSDKIQLLALESAVIYNKHDVFKSIVKPCKEAIEYISKQPKNSGDMHEYYAKTTTSRSETLRKKELREKRLEEITVPRMLEKIKAKVEKQPSLGKRRAEAKIRAHKYLKNQGIKSNILKKRRTDEKRIEG